MSFPLPSSLSPSKVASFKDCALAFRFSAIDRIPEPPTPWAAKGTLVHRALELLFMEEPAGRTLEVALQRLQQAVPEVMGDPEYADLTFETPEAHQAFLDDAAELVRKYFLLEDPSTIKQVGLELRLEVPVGSLTLRGVIDRLEEDENGDLVVTDYKTGKVPGVNQEQSRLGGVHFYAYLCEKALGRRPAKVQLLYLSQPMRIITEPSDQSIRGLQIRTSAIWAAVEKACEREDFRPKPSRLCDWCSFQAYCPAFGGDPASAPTRRNEPVPVRLGRPTDAAIAASRQDVDNESAGPGSLPPAIDLTVPAAAHAAVQAVAQAVAP